MKTTPRATLRAFTLIEILVVVAIIGLLAGVLIKNYEKIFGSTEKQIARLYVTTNLGPSLQMYRRDMGSYPSTAEGLGVLLLAPSNAERWDGPYAQPQGGKFPLDPWGEPYLYRSPGTKNKSSYDLYSKGPDRIEGTADDIGNW